MKDMINLFGNIKENTYIIFTQSDKVVIGSGTIIENMFQVGNFFNILLDSEGENINVYKNNLLLTLNRVQKIEQVDVYKFTELIEYFLMKDYKRHKRRFCDLLVNLFPKYYSKV